MVSKRKMVEFVRWAINEAEAWSGNQRPCFREAWKGLFSIGQEVLVRIVKDWYDRTTPEERQEVLGSLRTKINRFRLHWRELDKGECLWGDCTCQG